MQARGGQGSEATSRPPTCSRWLVTARPPRTRPPPSSSRSRPVGLIPPPARRSSSSHGVSPCPLRAPRTPSLAQGCRSSQSSASPRGCPVLGVFVDRCKEAHRACPRLLVITFPRAVDAGARPDSPSLQSSRSAPSTPPRADRRGSSSINSPVTAIRRPAIRRAAARPASSRDDQDGSSSAASEPSRGSSNATLSVDQRHIDVDPRRRALGTEPCTSAADSTSPRAWRSSTVPWHKATARVQGTQLDPESLGRLRRRQGPQRPRPYAERTRRSTSSPGHTG